MTVETANRMKFMFCCTSDKAVQICCCSLKMGSYIFMILTIIGAISQITSNTDPSLKTGSIIVGVINLALSLLFLISIIKFNFQLAYFCWIAYTIFTYIYTVGIIILIILTFNYIVSQYLFIIILVLVFTLLIMLYFNYIIYSVSKTIGYGQRALFDGDITATEIIGVNSNTDFGGNFNSNLMGNNNQENHNYRQI